LIDDDAPLREALAEALRDAGFSVDEASEGAEGLRIQRTHPADIVISDIFMPGEEGMETIFRLRSLYPKLKIIAISGGTARGGAYDYLPVAGDIGANCTLRKPFRMAEMLSAIHELLPPRDEVAQRSGKPS
jgi:DNA-binding response OmpR family regulator